MTDRQHYQLAVPDMSCQHCVRSVTQAMQALDPQADVRVDLTAKTASVNLRAEAAAVLAALDEAGYAARLS